MIDYLKNKLIVGRGASAIYLLLKTKFLDADVILPANICYAAIYPVLYSGNNPVFCDVDRESGNMTLNMLRCKLTKKTQAVVLPHMYGNPVAEVERIAEFCKSRGILLIEDCASSMGADLNGKMLGTFGDYAVFSTGYSKTIDLGVGGILASNFSLDKETELYASLDLFCGGAEITSSEFSKMYREFRNSKKDIRDSDFYSVCHNDNFNNYIYRISKDFESLIAKKIDTDLDRVIYKRKNDAILYNSLIEYCDIIKPYYYIDGAVPWRFNIYIASDVRDEFVNELLQMDVPVSDWYPVSSVLFDDYSHYPNAFSAEKSILNFPLLIGDKRIVDICKCINIVKDGIKNGIN